MTWDLVGHAKESTTDVASAVLEPARRRHPSRRRPRWPVPQASCTGNSLALCQDKQCNHPHKGRHHLINSHRRRGARYSDGAPRMRR